MILGRSRGKTGKFVTEKIVMVGLLDRSALVVNRRKVERESDLRQFRDTRQSSSWCIRIQNICQLLLSDTRYNDYQSSYIVESMDKRVA